MERIEEVRVPELGDFEDVDVVEVLVAPGDRVEAEGSLITLETDKASMEVPSPAAGTVKEVRVAVGDKVSEGTLIVILQVDEAAETSEAEREPGEEVEKAEAEKSPPTPPAPEPQPAASAVEAAEPPAPRHPPAVPEDGADEPAAKPHASPSVRRLARQLGVDLSQVQGTAPKGRILKEDVQAYVKSTLKARTGSRREGRRAGAPFTLPEMPRVDFSKFGRVEERPLSRIRKLSARNLHRSWLHVPHVTQFDEADITEMEAFRKAQREEAAEGGVRLTPLGFLMKASVAALRQFPEVNSSLDPSGEKLILKKYFHIAIAVDTPQGLVVPVIRDVDRLGLVELAERLSEVSARARQGKLEPGDLRGACFTISSLGGIGGTAFTPIVNAPEVAILGVSRSAWKPVYQGGEFVPRLILPLSLSYDHRVIDGALAVRFTTFLKGVLADIRRLLL